MNFLSALLVLLGVIILANGKMVEKVVKDGNKSIITYTDESVNYTKRVVLDGQVGPTTYATQSISLTTSGAFAATAYIYAVRTDNEVTITFKAVTGTVTSQNTLYFDVVNILNEDFYPGCGGLTAEYHAGWPFYVSDGGATVGKMFWYCQKYWSEPVGGWYHVAYFRAFGINMGYFSVGSGRGFDRDSSIPFFKY